MYGVPRLQILASLSRASAGESIQRDDIRIAIIHNSQPVQPSSGSASRAFYIQNCFLTVINGYKRLKTVQKWATLCACTNRLAELLTWWSVCQPPCAAAGEIMDRYKPDCAAYWQVLCPLILYPLRSSILPPLHLSWLQSRSTSFWNLLLCFCTKNSCLKMGLMILTPYAIWWKMICVELVYWMIATLCYKTSLQEYVL